MKLFLYSSYRISPEHSAALSRLVGKDPKDITIAAIEHATDVEPDAQDRIGESRGSLGVHGSQVEVVDVRTWQDNRAGRYEKLASKDVIWVCGGNGFYLRWILKESGADEMMATMSAHNSRGNHAHQAAAGKNLLMIGLIDEYRINVNPVVLGSGIPLFAGIQDTINLQLVHTRTYDSGVVGLHYRKGGTVMAAGKSWSAA